MMPTEPVAKRSRYSHIDQAKAARFHKPATAIRMDTDLLSRISLLSGADHVQRACKVSLCSVLPITIEFHS